MKRITIPKEFTGNVFFTSDLHFSHFNITKYCNRPFISRQEMNEALTTNWNEVVTNDDLVFVLGDFCFGSKKEWKKHLDNLNGKKYLILGNHDRPDEIYHDGFESVDDIVYLSIWEEETETYTNFCLFHYCMTSWPGQWNGVYHCFGHSHTSPLSTKQLDVDYIANRPLPSYDVGVDNNNFKPVLYQDLKTIFTQQLHGK